MSPFARNFYQVSLLATGLALNGPVAAGEDSAIDFARDIRPILSDNCFACHGPDEAHRKAKLRLDTKDGALADRDGSRAVVPGHPEQSDLIFRITTKDEDDLMPPKDSEKSLTPEQIELFKKWIASGAEWQEHWSFVPVKQPAIPEVTIKGAINNPIDNFILARLQRENLKPTPEADKATLLRRVTFDLTGLPPTIGDAEAFMADDSAGAYEKAVDRLLASPNYGENMARFWLDAARYGDTHGLHLDNYREMWPYRDWVVRAFNENKPFDQFVVDQIAGDLLENPTEDQIIATGFNRCNVSTAEGGSIEEEVYVRNVIDRVVTTGTVFMGLTMDCTRCHNHKFDPLTQDDFYSMFAYFNSLDGPALDGNRKDPAPVVEVPSKVQTAKRKELNGIIARTDGKMKADWSEVDAAQAAWVAETKKAFAPDPNLLTGQNFTAESIEAAYLEAETVEADSIESGSFKVTGFKADHFEGSNVRATGLKADSVRIKPSAGGSVTPVRLAAVSLGDWYSVGPFNDVERYLRSKKHGPEGQDINLEEEFATETDAKLKWKKRSDYVDGKPQNDLPGDMAANFIYRKILSPKDQDVTISLGSDDGIKVYLNNKLLLNKLVNRGVAADQEILELPLKKGENHLLIKVLNFGGASGYYFALKSEIQALPEAVYNIATNDGTELTDEQKTVLRAYYRNQVSGYGELVAVRGELKTSRDSLAEVERGIPTTLVWRESKEPKDSFILKRGEYDQKGEKVGRHTPRILPPMDGDLPNNRLGLAKWMVDPEHPLTARVTVNRFWQQLFGTGLVKTSEDFGSQGEPPSHPMLLDWLAGQFMADNWDVKQTMKRMVMSATYRQSSRISPELHQRDPANRLLARGPRFRLDAEMLRDQALFVSGLLNGTMGGPSVKPPQPDGLWFAVGYSGSNTVRFKADEGDDKVHRRTLYTFIKRTSPPPQMSTFDGPSRESCITRRERTNTPLQALLLWNDPQYVEAARALAQRALIEGGETDEDRAAYMFQLATGREATKTEVTDLMQACSEELEHYAANEAAAKELIKVGSAPVADNIEAPRLAAWTMTANLLLNLDEVIMKN